MPRIAINEILTELGAEPLDGSGFESEEPEAEKDLDEIDPEVAA